MCAVDALTGPHYGAKRQILAVITDPDAVRAILRCLGVDEDRGPPPHGSQTATEHPVDEEGGIVLFPEHEAAADDPDDD